MDSSERMQSFEDVRARLDEIVQAVSDDELPLDDALNLYEEAVSLGLRVSDLIEVGIDADSEEEGAPEAADPAFSEPLSGAFVAERVLALTRAADPVLLAVGNSYPHKDLATAVAAYGRICDRIPHRLVVVRIGRVVVGRRGRELACARIDRPVGG